jgi:hypothetical protein
MTKEHNLKGNCWDNDVVYDTPDGEMNDICDEHDEPRGDCSECPTCKACEDER